MDTNNIPKEIEVFCTHNLSKNDQTLLKAAENAGLHRGIINRLQNTVYAVGLDFDMIKRQPNEYYISYENSKWYMVTKYKV